MKICVKLIWAGLVMPFFAVALPDSLKFPDSPALSSGSDSGSTRESTKVIDEILSAARSGRNVGFTVGNTNLDSLAQDPELRKQLESGDSLRNIQARSYVSDKLCSLGVAQCSSSEGRLYGISGDKNNIRVVTLVQPVAVRPVGHPIAAIPLGQGNRPFGPVNNQLHSQVGPSNLYPYPTGNQGGFSQGPQGCTCVPVHQCNSYDVVSGGSESNFYPGGNGNYSPPPYNPSGGGFNNPYPPQNNYNPGFVSGNRPSYGQVGHGIDPRTNRRDSGSDFNATVVEARALPESPIKRVSRRETDNTRIVNHGCLEREVCCRYPGSSNLPGNQYPAHGGGCGRRNQYGTNGRVITGGQSNYGSNTYGDTEFGEYPWQVAVLRKEGYGSNIFVCGGTLIDSRHIIIAAHCIHNHRPQTLRVRLGEWDVGGETEFYPHVDLDVAAITVHPSFNSGNLFNDIAVIRIDGFVDFQRFPHVSPLCIPDKFSEFQGKRCVVTGWGKDAWGNQGNFQHRLKEVSVPVLKHYDCEQKLKRTRLGQGFVLHPGFLCAGGERNRDACEGDGGGPLACQVGNTWQLAGITSWGVGCGQRDVPGVYVKVSNYIDWIRQNIGY